MKHCKISNSKHQITRKSQIPISNDQNRFGPPQADRSLLFIWYLCFGISSPPFLLHLDIMVAVLLRLVLECDAGKVSKVIRCFSVFFSCQSNVQHLKIIGIDKDIINSFGAKSKGSSLLGLT